MTSESINRLCWHEIIPNIKYLPLKNITKGGNVDVCRSIISNFIDILRKNDKNDVRIDKQTILTLKYPKYQILTSH